MKLLPRLIIALLICLMAIPVLAVPEQVQAARSIVLYPESGNVGDEVRIRGYDFDSHEDVDIYYCVEGSDCFDGELIEEEFDVGADGNFTYEFDIPESCSGDHYICVCYTSTACAKEYFEVEPKIELDDDEGFVGDEVEVTGTGFAEDEEDIRIRYDGDEVAQIEEAETDEYGTWTATFVIPESTGGEHDIDAKGDDTASADVDEVEFKVKPKITLSPKSGSVGDIVTVTATGFEDEEANIKIKYDDDEVEQIEEAETDEHGSWTATFKVPPSVEGSYEVDARGKYTEYGEVDAVTFKVAPGMTLAPATSATSPGHVGLTITVTGGGFEPGVSLTITYENQTASAVTTSEGNFPSSGTVTFEAKGMHGAQKVAVEDDLGHVLASETFFMEENPPAAPEPLSPANGTGVGFVGKVTPTFEWSKVTDASGIASYELQISTNSTNFTVPLVSLGIPGENITALDDTITYTLPKDYALSGGTYYWRLRAVDAAANEGQWTIVQSFHAGGRLPLWGLIAIIVLAGVLVGFLVYFFVIRPRRSYYD
jgi:exosome complex RNA-binding protein Csl4